MKAKLFAAALLLAATPAQATVYQWAWDGGQWEGSGYLTTMPVGASFEHVIDITGYFHNNFGADITSINLISTSGPAYTFTDRGPNNLLFVSSPSLLDFQGLGFLHDIDHNHIDGSWPANFATTIHACEPAMPPPCYQMSLHEQLGSHGHNFGDRGAFSISAVPGPSLGTGLPGLLMLWALWRRRRCARSC